MNKLWRFPHITRRHLQVALGVLWLFDGLLQLQPFMFTRGFARQVIAPAADGSPRALVAGVTLAAHVIAGHPAFWNALFAAVQLALGIGLLWRPTVRAALAGSVAWGLGVWVLGESLGGLAGGHASLVTGAPGAAVLYAVLAAGIWPTARPDGDDSPAAWLGAAWAVLWIGAALLQTLPGRLSGSTLASQVTDSGATGWLGGLTHAAASGARHGGPAMVVALVLTMALVGAAGVAQTAHGQVRLAGVGLGIGLAVLFWVVGQGAGQLATGMATDPNTAVPVVLLGLAAIGASRREPRITGMMAPWERERISPPTWSALRAPSPSTRPH
ncbi:MAG TPA: hypothetical protein VFW71_10565 [Actinomycetota bacterium]|nr:hypothetical protein [Actinomycetota bacterium]